MSLALYRAFLGISKICTGLVEHWCCRMCKGVTALVYVSTCHTGKCVWIDGPGGRLDVDSYDSHCGQEAVVEIV